MPTAFGITINVSCMRKPNNAHRIHDMKQTKTNGNAIDEVHLVLIISLTVISGDAVITIERNVPINPRWVAATLSDIAKYFA